MVDLTIGKRWTGSAWVDIDGFISGALEVSIDPATASGLDNRDEPAPAAVSVGTSNVTATPFGGTGPYTYLWEYVSGDASFTVSSATAATVSWTALVTKNSSKSATWKVTVTDSLAATATANVSIDVEYSTNI